MAVGIVAAAAFCHDSMTSRRGTEVPGFSPGRAARAEAPCPPEKGGTLSLVDLLSDKIIFILKPLLVLRA